MTEETGQELAPIPPEALGERIDWLIAFLENSFAAAVVVAQIWPGRDSESETALKRLNLKPLTKAASEARQLATTGERDRAVQVLRDAVAVIDMEARELGWDPLAYEGYRAVARQIFQHAFLPEHHVNRAVLNGNRDIEPSWQLERGKPLSRAWLEQKRCLLERFLDYPAVSRPLHSTLAELNERARRQDELEKLDDLTPLRDKVELGLRALTSDLVTTDLDTARELASEHDCTDWEFFDAFMGNSLALCTSCSREYLKVHVTDRGPGRQCFICDQDATSPDGRDE